jgi:hypothetical protein
MDVYITYIKYMYYEYIYIYVCLETVVRAKGGLSCSIYIDTTCSIYMYTILQMCDTYIIYTCKYMYVLKPLSRRKAVCCVVHICK